MVINMTRTFHQQSQLVEGNLALALAPALTPTGIVQDPNFFQGFVSHPQVIARSLLVLADIVATRYFNYTPKPLRDPILSAQGDRLRAECFSACNGVYARLDLLQSGFDGQIDYGTTNVDIGMELRTALSQIKQQDKLYMSIGYDGFSVTPIQMTNDNIISLGKKVIERPVQMPNRWVRALGNAAEIHKDMKASFTLNKTAAQGFVASLPPATGKSRSGWLIPTATGIKMMPRSTSGAIYVSGLHRLSALKRIMTNIEGMTFYAPIEAEPGVFMLMVALPSMRLTISLTAEAWRGYSGEGSLLESLAQADILEAAETIISTLEFDAVISETQIAKKWQMSKKQVQGALSILALSGKLGFDAHDNAYFHRELPHDPTRVSKDNPRLMAARKLVNEARRTDENKWSVPSKDIEYLVTFDKTQGAHRAKCTCTWYLNHQNERGPCKHILAVQLKEESHESKVN